MLSRSKSKTLDDQRSSLLKSASRVRGDDELEVQCPMYLRNLSEFLDPRLRGNDDLRHSMRNVF